MIIVALVSAHSWPRPQSSASDSGKDSSRKPATCTCEFVEFEDQLCRGNRDKDTGKHDCLRFIEDYYRTDQTGGPNCKCMLLGTLAGHLAVGPGALNRQFKTTTKQYNNSWGAG
jgi:hypothetical protein